MHLEAISPVGEVIDARLAQEGTCHLATPCPFSMPYGRVDARIARSVLARRCTCNANPFPGGPIGTRGRLRDSTARHSRPVIC